MTINNTFAPHPLPAYTPPRPAINEAHFREWVENKVGYERSRNMQSDEWTCLEAEYRKEHGIK